MSDLASRLAMDQQPPGSEKLCCNGKCRLAAIQQMSREELMDAVVTAEEALGMAEMYIEELEKSC